MSQEVKPLVYVLVALSGLLFGLICVACEYAYCMMRGVAW